MDIKKRRLKLGMTQVDLALACGVCIKTVVTWERGVGKISEKNRVKLDRVLGVKNDSKG